MEPQNIKAQSYFERLLHMTELTCQLRKQDICNYEKVFHQVEKDIQAINTADFHFNPMLDRAYAGRGVFRFTVCAYTAERRTHILTELMARGYEYTADSTDDLRVLKRDSIYFVVTIDPIRTNKKEVL